MDTAVVALALGDILFTLLALGFNASLLVGSRDLREVKIIPNPSETLSLPTSRTSERNRERQVLSRLHKVCQPLLVFILLDCLSLTNVVLTSSHEAVAALNLPNFLVSVEQIADCKLGQSLVLRSATHDFRLSSEASRGLSLCR